jgi:beta-glucosidase
MLRSRWLAAVLSLGLFSCSSEEEAPDGGLAFPEIGSLSDPAGKDGFRFGAASAATQIEDENPNTDWYVFTQPTSEGGLVTGSPSSETPRAATRRRSKTSR